MKIKVDETSYIEIKIGVDKKLILSMRTDKDDRTSYVISMNLDSNKLDTLIAELISKKNRVK
tara:strand:- start:2453 stop:2638 length:186 start_codon:yes stop_codon:yes gene_type:complete